MKIRDLVMLFNFESILKSNKGWFEDKIGVCNLISKCYKNCNDSGSSLKSLLRSFEYDVLRAFKINGFNSYTDLIDI